MLLWCCATIQVCIHTELVTGHRFRCSSSFGHKKQSVLVLQLLSTSTCKFSVILGCVLGCSDLTSRRRIVLPVFDWQRQGAMSCAHHRTDSLCSRSRLCFVATLHHIVGLEGQPLLSSNLWYCHAVAHYIASPLNPCWHPREPFEFI